MRCVSVELPLRWLQQRRLNRQLVNACVEGRVRRADRLLGQGASADACTLFERISVLEIAITNRDIALIQLLVRSGADLSRPLILGMPALEAARFFHLDQRIINILKGPPCDLDDIP